MSDFFQIILATIFISVISFVGILSLIFKERILEKILLFLVALSAGALIGGSFLHLLPEATQKFANADIFIWVLISFVFFFLVEKVLHWRHCHKGHCEIHTFGTINLFGDAIHNFIDGLIIAVSFIVSTQLGWITTLAIALHEIPQEIGDFGVLIYSGFSKSQAITFNFLSALLAIFGGVIGYFLANSSESLIKFLLPAAAGGFIYIAGSDLLPEIRKETNLNKSLISMSVFLIGILIMYLAKIFGVE